MDKPSPPRHDTLAVLLGTIAAFVCIALALLLGFPLAIWLLADDDELMHGALFRTGIDLLVALVILGAVSLAVWGLIVLMRRRP